MARIAVKINGEEYPCYFTFGAGLNFKQITGHDISKMDMTDTVELGTLLYCQCAAACRREKIEFKYSLEDFLDQITDEDIMSMNQEPEVNSKKK